MDRYINRTSRAFEHESPEDQRTLGLDTANCFELIPVGLGLGADPSSQHTMANIRGVCVVTKRDLLTDGSNTAANTFFVCS
jgi:hypothetical protein